jgi:release factor glutamine methyltransferase
MLKDLLDAFFQQHHKELTQNYPGINLFILQRFANSYLLKNQSSLSLKRKLRPFLNDVQNGIPFEYIIGEAFFYNSPFITSTKTLIPRNETEELVELGRAALLEKIKKTTAPLKIADIGVGTGNIFISLLQGIDHPFIVTCSDIQDDILNVAKKNFFRLRYTLTKDIRVNFVQSDRMNNIKGQFDLIITNPPYIDQKDDDSLVHQQVKKHEPHSALYYPPEKAAYYDWFHHFLKDCYNALLSGGIFLMEGHENHLDNIKTDAHSLGFKNLEVINDLCHKKRILIGKKE